MMVSNAARYLEQPSGGYLNPNAMDVIELKTDDELYPQQMERITGGEIGTAVDYLTRFHLTGNLKESFAISISGAARAGKLELAEKLLEEVKGLDKKSIIATVKLASFDVFVRNPIRAMMSGLNQATNVSDEAIYNIQIMVKRCLQLFDEYGPITGCHLLFTGAYTKNISSGDADYLTADTIWDIKTVKKDIGIQDTYQILLYYLLSQHSDLKKYKTIKRLGIFNPRINKIHLIYVDNIDCRIINYINKYIIGYEDAEDVTLIDLKNALDNRPSYPHYPTRKGTTKLLEKLIHLDFSENEKLYILRATKTEFIRMKLAESIEKDNIQTSERVLEKEIELMKKYNEKPNRIALKLFNK